VGGAILTAWLAQDGSLEAEAGGVFLAAWMNRMLHKQL
jgi:hypothetical protein